MQYRHIRHSIATYVQTNGPHLLRLTPTMLTIGIAAAALGPPVLAAVTGAGIVSLGGLVTELGRNVLYDWLKGFCERQQQDRVRDEAVIRANLEAALLEDWDAARPQATQLRAAISDLLQRIEGVNVAIESASDAIRDRLVLQFAQVGDQFDEFHWLLRTLQDDLAEIQTIVKETRDLVRHLYIQSNMVRAVGAEAPDNGREIQGPPDTENTPPADVPCPYAGLLAFEESQADFFCGRTFIKADLTLRLKESRFVTVVGRSGSGKSSLVRAGLLPALRQGALPGSTQWQIEVMKPGAQPLTALAERIAPRINVPPAIALRRLEADARALDLIARESLGSSTSARLLLVIDQFEELFTSCDNEPARARFIQLLLLATEPGGSTSVVITLRDDHFGSCGSYPDLAQVVQDSTLLVGPLSPRELLEVIEQPARLAGLRLEDGLVGRIFEEVKDHSGALPLLSHALRETWERRRGRTLTISGYDETGGVRKALQHTATQVYESFSAEEKQVAGSIALRLTNLGESRDQDTSRRASRVELMQMWPDRRGVVLRVLDALADARLIVTDKSTVEMAHEALLTAWPDLARWLDQNRRERQIYQELTVAAQDWDRKGRPHDLLYRGAILAAALEVAGAEQGRAVGDSSLGIGYQVNQLEREYLQASHVAEIEETQAKEELLKKQLQTAQDLANARQRELVVAQDLAQANDARAAAERQARDQAERRVAESNRARGRITCLAIVLGLLSLVALLLVGAGFGLYYLSNQSAEMARQAEAEAITNQVAAEVYRYSDAEPDRAWLLGSELIRRNDPEGTAVLMNAMAQNRHLSGYLHGHTNWVYDVAYHPDGTILASTDEDGMLWFWNASTGKVWRAPVQASSYGLRRIAFTPQGLLAVGDANGRVQLWDLEGEPEGDPLDTSTSGLEITGLAVSPDGNWLASTAHDSDQRQETVLWDLRTREHYILDKDTPFEGVSFNQDSTVLATAGANGVQLWEVASREPFSTPDIKLETYLRSVAFSPTEPTTLATGSDEGVVQIWDISTGKEIQGHTEHGGQVLRLAFSPNGALLASSGEDRRVILWDVKAMEQFTEPLVGHKSFVWSVAFHPKYPDWTGLASASADRSVILWTVKTAPLPQFVTSLDEEVALEGAVFALAASKDGRVASGGSAGEVVIWDPDRQQEPLRLTNTLTDVYSIAFSPDSTLLAAADRNGRVVIWTVADQREIGTFSLSSGWAGRLAFSPDGSLLAVGGEQGEIAVWDVVARAKLPGIKLPDDTTVWSIAFHPSDATLAAAGNDRQVTFWDPRTGKEAGDALSDFTNQLRSLAYSPNGKLLAVGSSNGEIRLFDLATGRRIGEPLHKHAGQVWSLTFSLDGATLASTGTDQRLNLWDTANGTHLGALPGHESVINSVAFTPDGRRLVTGDGGGIILLWNLNSEDLLSLACELAARNLTEDEQRRFLGLISGTPSKPCLEPDLNAAHLSALGGDADKAREQYRVLATQKAVDYPAATNNEICWYGSLHGFAAEVMPSCERAVERSPKLYQQQFVDSRGVARLLTGDKDGARADFELFVRWARSRDLNDLADKRQDWIVAIDRGENPLADPTVRLAVLHE